MKRRVLIIFIFTQLFFSCKSEEYCAKEIRNLTNLSLPEEIEVLECEDNLEYQFVFEYRLNDLSQANVFIEDNQLKKYVANSNNGSTKEMDAVDYVGEFFNPNKTYPKSDEIYYVQKDNFTVVFDKTEGVFMGVVEY